MAYAESELALLRDPGLATLATATVNVTEQAPDWTICLRRCNRPAICL